MRAIDLTKRIERGSWRWIGQRVAGISPMDTPIGEMSVPALLHHVGGSAWRIGRIHPRNAFVIDRPPLRLLYVRAGYGGYRYAAKKVFSRTPSAVDFDHAFGRHMAQQLGFHYVLLIRIIPSVNRGHGRFEKAEPATGFNLAKLCFANQRILDNGLAAAPKSGTIPAGSHLIGSIDAIRSA